MSLGKSIVSGIIGVVFCSIVMWFVFGIFTVPLEMTNVYFAVGAAGFFSSFFGSYNPFLGKRSSATNPKTDVDQIIQTKQLEKIYGENETEVIALNKINIEFLKSQFTAIMGPSGSGKSTLLHCLAGLDNPTSGSIYINDTDLSILNDKQLTKLRRDSFGFVFQSYNLIPTLTAAENISLPSSIAGNSPDEEWIDKIIEKLDLHDRLNHRPNELSGGQQQKVAVARALASKPSVIFADEPTGNLDSTSSEELLAFLKIIVNELNQTVIMVTHDPIAASFADRVIFLRDGSVFNDLKEPSKEQIITIVSDISSKG